MHSSLVGKPPVERTADEQALADEAIRTLGRPHGIDLTRIAARCSSPPRSLATATVPSRA
jgi:hypothetical protein